MNENNPIKNIGRNKKTLSIVLGIVLVASLGAILYAWAQSSGDGTEQANPNPTNPSAKMPKIEGSVNLAQQLLSSVHTKFTEAANTAAGNVTNGQVIGGSLTVMQGYVVYNFKVVDGKNIYSVIVDAGDGKILYTSQGHPIQIGSLFGMGHHGMMDKSHMRGGAWKSHEPSTPASPNGTQ